jgi:hypothetical protein
VVVAGKNNWLNDGVDISEVDHDTVLIQSARHDHFELVRVAVQVRAGALVPVQPVCCFEAVMTVNVKSHIDDNTATANNTGIVYDHGSRSSYCGAGGVR